MRWWSACATTARASAKPPRGRMAASASPGCASACRPSAAALRSPVRRARASRCTPCFRRRAPSSRSGSRLRCEQARAHGDQRELRRIRRAELLLDVVQVRPDRARAEGHDRGDVLDRLAACERHEYLELLLAQGIERLRARLLGGELLRDLRLEEVPALMDLADGLDQRLGGAALGEI